MIPQNAFLPRACTIVGLAMLTAVAAPGTRAQDTGSQDTGSADVHQMWMRPISSGWTVMGMAQAYPILSTGLFAEDDTPPAETALYLTQPTAMFNVESPGSRVVLRSTLNFEGLTQPDGELTFGAWGEGFLDKRHPHTLVHELMLSANFWRFAGGSLSLSAGKGFAPYGTDDPMSRPVAKYPTNHHLSQILERWTANAVYLIGDWSLEAGLFGGGEPDGPYDFSNIESFGDSWSARVARRLGSGSGSMAAWEMSLSFARVREEHGESLHVSDKRYTSLASVALRHESAYGFGSLYAMIEGSFAQPYFGDDYISWLGETRLEVGRHRPYYRVEVAIRPEYARLRFPGNEGFYRYDHDSQAIGTTRWLIVAAGHAYELTGYPLGAKPFVEVQFHHVSAETGGVEPEALFGGRSFAQLTVGIRLHLGGDSMRMGAYGVLDAMTARHAMSTAPQGGHGDHGS
jgi:hypothetical protein